MNSLDVYNANSGCNSTGSCYFDWTQRPESLKSRISNAFNDLVKQSSSEWGLNGCANYHLCGVDEYSLMKKIIMQASLTQKTFYALDIGAGNFEWGQGLADYLDKQTDLPKDIKVHIIGVRGESYLGERVIETDRCKIYNLGAFKAEELFAEFQREGLDLENKVDLTVSHWCFRHLIDPVGTLAQVYNLLRPETGFLLVDGFLFAYEQETEDMDRNRQMTQLFLDMKVPFLTQVPEDCRGGANQFMLKRPNCNPCSLPMSYLGEEQFLHDNFSRARFTREPQGSDSEEFDFPSPKIHNYKLIFGDKGMFDWLENNGLFTNKLYKEWMPLQSKDSESFSPSLHRAVQAKERAIEAVEFCLDRGDNINALDSQGNTALQKAIFEKCSTTVDLLLKRGASVKVIREGDETCLHTAAFHDKEGPILRRLIAAGADVNASTSDEEGWVTPLDYAIHAKNCTAIELLIRAGATVSEQNRIDLQGKAFSSIQNKNLF